MKELCFKILEQSVFSPLRQAALSRLEEIRRICFVNLGGLGDYMLFSPTVKVYRHEYPNAHFTLLTAPNYAAVNTLFPEIDEVVILQPPDMRFMTLYQLLKQGRYDALIISYEFAIPAWMFSLAIGFSGIPIRVGCERNELRRAVLTASTPDQSHRNDSYLMDLLYAPSEAFFKLVGKSKSVSPDLMAHFRYQSRPEEKQRLHELLSKQPLSGGSPRIVIHPGSSRNSKAEQWFKSWPAESWPAESWRSLIEQLIREYPQGIIYLTGGPDDAEEIAAIEKALQHAPLSCVRRVVNLYGQLTTTPCLAELLSEADVFIGCDSFAMHLALFAGAPLVAIFALTNEKRFLPSHHPLCRTATRNDLTCRPCYPVHRSNSCNNPICQEVPVSEVFRQVQHHLRPPGQASFESFNDPAMRRQPVAAYPG